MANYKLEGPNQKIRIPWLDFDAQRAPYKNVTPQLTNADTCALNYNQDTFSPDVIMDQCFVNAFPIMYKNPVSPDSGEMYMVNRPGLGVVSEDVTFEKHATSNSPTDGKFAADTVGTLDLLVPEAAISFESIPNTAIVAYSLSSYWHIVAYNYVAGTYTWLGKISQTTYGGDKIFLTEILIGTRPGVAVVCHDDFGNGENSSAWYVLTSLIQWKTAVKCATTTSGTLISSFENGDVIDGYTLATGDRILIKNQSSAAENGIYTVNASGAPTRATDCDAGSEFTLATVRVLNGWTNAGTSWYQTATVSVVNTDANNWSAYTTLPWAGPLTQITDTDFPANQAAYQKLTGPMIQMNGTCYVLTERGEIWNSDTGTIADWNSAGYQTAIMYPDRGVGLCRMRHHLVVFGSKSIEFFNDEGVAPPDSPLMRTDQAFIKMGTITPRSYININDTIYFLTWSEGALGLFKLDGYTPIRISQPTQTWWMTQTIDPYLQTINLFDSTHLILNIKKQALNSAPEATDQSTAGGWWTANDGTQFPIQGNLCFSLDTNEPWLWAFTDLNDDYYINTIGGDGSSDWTAAPADQPPGPEQYFMQLIVCSMSNKNTIEQLIFKRGQLITNAVAGGDRWRIDFDNLSTTLGVSAPSVVFKNGTTWVGGAQFADYYDEGGTTTGYICIDTKNLLGVLPADNYNIELDTGTGGTATALVNGAPYLFYGHPNSYYLGVHPNVLSMDYKTDNTQDVHRDGNGATTSSYDQVVWLETNFIDFGSRKNKRITKLEMNWDNAAVTEASAKLYVSRKKGDHSGPFDFAAVEEFVSNVPRFSSYTISTGDSRFVQFNLGVQRDWKFAHKMTPDRRMRWDFIEAIVTEMTT